MKAQALIEDTCGNLFHENIKKTIIAKLSEKKLKQVEVRLDRIEAVQSELRGLREVEITKIANDIAKVVLETLRSAEHVGQRVYWKMKKRKLNNGNTAATSQFNSE